MSLPNLGNVSIDSVRLSDLFFNHEHPKFEESVVNENPSADALLEDAKEFVNTLIGHHNDHLAQLLVTDFFDRL